MISRWSSVLCAIAMLIASAPAFAQPAPFHDPALARNSANVLEQMATEAGRPAASADELLEAGEAALARGDARAALEPLSAAAISEAGNFRAWLSLARAARAVVPQDWSERFRIRERAVVAAYQAYRAAPDLEAEAQALALLGEAQADRELWRGAIDALKASVDRVTDAETLARYEELRARFGFRVLGYEVDSDSASPRICFDFSEPLRARYDFTPFVAVAGAANAAVTAEESRLCVDGVRFGERYSIVLRRGLPSNIGEDLLASADYEVYVRDRAPQVRFTGRNYVLPRLGQEGIPLVSVNAETLLVDIYRIGDRGLLGTLRGQDFLSQIARWSADEIAKEQGQKVWNGELDVVPELNQEVVTAFPALDALGPLEPGVYVMTARVKGLVSEEDDWGNRATQWFVVSDLGLTAFSGPDGVHVLVRSLASAAALPEAEITLVARNNEILATAKADADGYVRFDPGLSRGLDGLSPALVTARLGDDYGFLDLGQSAFDLSDRGVTGRPAAGPLEAYLFPERGVYRSGETVNLTALLRDNAGDAASGLPLTLVVRRPDGVEDRRATVTDQGLGGRAYAIPLLAGAMRGTWRIAAHVDPNGPAIGETSFLVEDYVPERIALTLSPREERLPPGAIAEIDIEARYLYGAPAAGLAVSGEVAVTPAEKTGVPGLGDYEVGLQDEYVESYTAEVEGVFTTDREGRAVFSAQIPALAAPRPLQARVAVRVAETGGRAVERAVVLPILPDGPVIGIRKAFGKLAEGANATFDIVAAEPDGTRLDVPGASWSLYRVERRYQWFRSDGRWGFEPVTSTRRVASGTIDLTTGEPARISAPVAWGSYRLDVAGARVDLQPASVSFSVGWAGDQTADAPDLLDMSLDRQAYASGDTMRVNIEPRFSGRATIFVVSDRVRLSQVVDIAPGGTQVLIPVEADWGSGAYVVALAHRPLDAAARRQPGRALGLAWFSIDRAARELDMRVDAPARARPREPLTLPVSLTGLAPGEEAYVTIAAVDVGILNLTRYSPPDPTAFFLGQKRLSAEIRDLYGFLIDGMQGTRGAVRSGGDFAPPSLDAPPPDQEPLARYSGVVRVDDEGRAVVDFHMPAFNGTLRVMGVAWSRTRLGQVSADVVVRDPVVVAGTLPRFLNAGDRSRLHLQLDNVEAPAGDYVLEVEAEGPVGISPSAMRHAFRLEAGARREVEIPIAADLPGTGRITVTLTGGGLDLSRSYILPVQPGTGALVRREVRTLAAGDSLRVTEDLLADIMPGTGAVSVTVSPLAALDVAGLLQALDRYPYGCSEQIVSRAMPLLYVNELSAGAALPPDTDVDGRIRDAIAQVLARQNSSGAFGLWSVGMEDDLWLDAYIVDFLTRAGERGFDVPRRAFDQALDRLRNHVANTTEVDGAGGAALAYAAYVLARNGRPVMGDLRYLADTRIKAFETPLARAQIAAGLALLGDRTRAERAFASALDALRIQEAAKDWRTDYGSRLRDGAGMLTLVAEAGLSRAAVTPIAGAIERERAATPFTSTQEQAWMVLAAQALQAQAQDFRLDIAGLRVEGAFNASFAREELASGGIPIDNRGAAPVQVAITVTGNPLGPEPAEMRGYEITRSYYRLDGSEADPSRVGQNERLVVVLRVTEPEGTFARLLVVDRLPAGFEIDNPNLVDGTMLAALPWLTREEEIANLEYRDDRFVAAFNRRPGQSPFITLAYTVRAVAPGTYIHPPAFAENMYRPERFGRTGFGRVEVTGR